MSKEYSSDCVDCGLPCLGRSCPHYQRVDYYCDYCNGSSNNAEYEIDGEHYCEECVKEYLQEIFDDLSLNERAEVLEVDLHTIW